VEGEAVSLTFEPLFELWTSVILFAPPVALVAWQLWRSRGWRVRWAAIRRLGILALLVLAAFGPAIPGGMTKVVVSDVDVFLVIDTTTSSNAEDMGTGPDGMPITRLDAMKADAMRVAEIYGGARYSVISFDNGALVRMPLVSDPTSLRSTLDTLEVELAEYAGGSSISEALPTLLRRLQGASEQHPERLRLVFYFGDGEQTRDSPPESMADAAPFISDGAVFGYGTAAGGPMRPNLDYGDDAQAPYLLDTTQAGSPIARSRIDEDALRTLAGQLGVGYQHRELGQDAAYPDIEDRMGEEIEVPEVAVAQRLYWIPVIPAFLLLLWDLVIAARNLGELRAARPARRVRPARAQVRA
jgi:Ca-activated chloride channel family protein